MAFFNLQYDLTQIEPSGASAGRLPVSDAKGHVVRIIDCETKDTQAGGSRLVFTLEVAEGEHAGATGQWGLNIICANEKAVEIAYKDLASLCHVTGTFPAAGNVDLSVWNGKPFRAVVTLDDKNQEQYPGRTKVKNLLHLDGSKPGQSKAPVVPSVPAAPSFTQPAFTQTKAPMAPIYQAEAAPIAPAMTAPTASPAGNTPPWAKKA